MSLYRKKPIEVEAFQWELEMGEIGPVKRDWNVEGYRPKDAPYLNLYRIETLEGWMRVSPGDWIIRGIKGEFYPCKPDIFEGTYESVEAQP